MAQVLELELVVQIFVPGFEFQAFVAPEVETLVFVAKVQFLVLKVLVIDVEIQIYHLFLVKVMKETIKVPQPSFCYLHILCHHGGSLGI